MMRVSNKQTVFITTVCTPYGRQRAGLLIDSLRAFGGYLSQNPVWLFEADRQAECHRLAQDGLTVIPIQVPEAIKPALFSEKVFACAQAEAMAGADIGSLVWIDPGCLVVNLPVLYELGAGFDAALRPVHIQNVGLRVEQPLPFSALDVLTAHTLRDQVVDLLQDPAVSTRTALLVTHSVEEAVYMADRVVAMRSNPGRVAEVVTIEVPRPRRWAAPELVPFVDRLYALMT